MRAHILRRLSLHAPGATDVAEQIKNTPYEKDFSIDAAYIKRVRVKEADEIWRLNEDARDSCEAMVRPFRRGMRTQARCKQHLLAYPKCLDDCASMKRTQHVCSRSTRRIEPKTPALVSGSHARSRRTELNCS